MSVVSLTEAYERLGGPATAGEFGRLVLDEDLRALLTSESVLRRGGEAREAGVDITPTALYTWAAEASGAGEPGTTAVKARLLTAQHCVDSPGGVDALMSTHQRLVEEGGGEEEDHLLGVLPLVVLLLTEEGRDKEVDEVLAHLEHVGDHLAWGMSLCWVGGVRREVVERYVRVESASLSSGPSAIYGDVRLRRRLIVLARVCGFVEAPEELRELKEAFRRRPREFTALYWGNEYVGALVEDALGLVLPGMRLRQEACRERWYFDGVVARLRSEESPRLLLALLVSAAQRSNQVARWLAEEPATGPIGGRSMRLRVLLRRARIPRKSLYAELLTEVSSGEAHPFDPAEVRALRNLVTAPVPVAWRDGLFFVALLIVVQLGKYWGAPWWSTLPVAILAGLALTVVGAVEWTLHGCYRVVLLPRWSRPDKEWERLGLLIGYAVKVPYARLIPHLHSESYWKARLEPLWEVVAFRERIQADSYLASRLARRLGRYAIHSADDISHLLARRLPSERVRRPACSHPWTRDTSRAPD